MKPVIQNLKFLAVEKHAFSECLVIWIVEVYTNITYR